jgi:hypothetical protein
MGTIHHLHKSLSIKFGFTHWYILLLGLLFLGAGLIRLDELHAPGHLIDREYTSAIFARAFYFDNNLHIDPWRQKAALDAMRAQPILEPPLTEYLVSLIYRGIGREDFTVSRYLTNAFWLVGGVFFFWVTRRLFSPLAALLAVGYYLLNPMGILISRSFQPDALMMMLFMISLYGMVRYFKKPCWRWLFFTAGFTGLALLLRPLILFTLICAFIALAWSQRAKWSREQLYQFLVFFGVGLSPMAIYYGYGLLIENFMVWKVTTSFRPYMLVHKEFWQSWFANDIRTIGPVFLLCGLLGLSMIQKGLARALVIGLTVGYFIFGLSFTYHISTHPYYHIQLIPIVALCIAPFLLRLAKALYEARSGIIAVGLVVIGAFYFSHAEVRSNLYLTPFEEPAIAAKIGAIVGHSSRVVFVARFYGVPLQYFGEFTGKPWPVRIDSPLYRPPGANELSVQERIDSLGFEPEYYVITFFDLFRRKHTDLEEYLKSNCTLEAKSEQYLVFSSCQPAGNQ